MDTEKPQAHQIPGVIKSTGKWTAQVPCSQNGLVWGAGGQQGWAKWPQRAIGLAPVPQRPQECFQLSPLFLTFPLTPGGFSPEGPPQSDTFSLPEVSLFSTALLLPSTGTLRTYSWLQRPIAQGLSNSGVVKTCVSQTAETMAPRNRDFLRGLMLGEGGSPF